MIRKSMPSGHDPMGGYRFSLTTNAKRLRGDHAQTKSESLTAHASRRSRRSLLSMRLLCFNELDLILRRSPTGRANARPMTGSVAVSKDGLQYRFVIPGTRAISVSIESKRGSRFL